MGSIRVGFFDDFNGADTLLIDVDAEGLRDLIAWLRNVISSGQKVALGDCPGVSLQSGLQVQAFRCRDDIGLVRIDERAFPLAARTTDGRTSSIDWKEWKRALAISISTARGMTCK
jgi:hypothetical protein